ncbi:MAG TPA: diguanylate cyclase [Acidimicrobiales bacterium]|nr:diguanylate cyclase [Acidimicrobiales bacterium]
MTSPHRRGQADLDLLPVGVAHVDPAGTIVRANRMIGELVGVPADTVVGRSLFEFAAGDMDRYAAMLDFSTGYDALMGPVAVTYRRADGSLRQSALWARNHLDDPDVAALVCTFVPEDTTGGLAAALASVAEGDDVDDTLALLSAALRGNPFEARGCWLVRDGSGRRLAGDADLIDAARAALAQPGAWWRATRGTGLVTCDDTRHGDEYDRLLSAAGIVAWWALPCQGSDDAEAAILVLRTELGPLSPLQHEQLDQLATTAGLAFQRAAMQARLAHAAFHDPLTGLANRGRFFHRDDARLQAGAALLYVDLDRFKPVNDRLGHTAGDLVLVTVADRIRRAVRPSDRITRFGGDEFVVECAGVATDDEAVVIAERIIAAIQEPIRLDLGEIQIGASIGIARTDEAVGVDDLLDRSDVALLAAKAAGKGRWHLAGPG